MSREYNWNAYNQLIPNGITNTEGVVIPGDETILFTLIDKDFPKDYDVVKFIMSIVRDRDQGNYPVSGPITFARTQHFFKMRFKFQPNDSETGAVYANIEYADISIDPLKYEVTQVIYNLHTAEQLKYKYEDLDDLEEKLELNFGYEYDRKLRGIE